MMKPPIWPSAVLLADAEGVRGPQADAFGAWMIS
jgi:hypothetical protein